MIEIMKWEEYKDIMKSMTKEELELLEEKARELYEETLKEKESEDEINKG